MAESSGYKEYVAGMLAGVATVITGHPFDTVKVTNSNTWTHRIVLAVFYSCIWQPRLCLSVLFILFAISC